MPRVIAGTAGGRPLKVPTGDGTRPTSDRVKEALFSSLGDLTGLVVLDLYAGSGGLGVEALSRGAASAVFVEHDRRAAALVRHNLKVAGVDRQAQVLTTTVASFCADPSGGPFDVVLADPPYRLAIDRIDRDFAGLLDAGAIADGAQIVLERTRRVTEPPPARLVHRRDRTYGETMLRYLTTQPNPSTPAEGAPTS